MDQAPEQEQTSPSLAVVGGGISGLTAAYYAIQQGQRADSITVYEGAQRLGGKIQTGYLADGSPVNMGAEFIDSTHTRLVNLCNELGVPLERSEEQGSELFQRADGSVMEGAEFHRQYEPLAARIREHKKEVEANPTGDLAQQINDLSLSEYLAKLRETTPRVENPGMIQRVRMMLANDKNEVSPEITMMALQAFSSETGQPARNINALQYLHEASSEAGAFLDSDCAYRVEGGTENIIHALEEKLKEAGVQFRQGAQAERVVREANGIQIDFKGDAAGSAVADKVVLALPAYALGGISGLETLGLPPETQDFIANTQYTRSVKFTVKLKEGVEAPDANFFANHGMQVWSGDEGSMTFLVNSDKLDKLTPNQLIEGALNNYARAMGTSPDQVFDTSQGNIVFNNPGKNACYASPAPGAELPLEHLGGALETLAQNGIALSGTYFPHRNGQSVTVGFMECGAATSERAAELLVEQQRERPMWLQQALDRKPEQARQPAGRGV